MTLMGIDDHHYVRSVLMKSFHNQHTLRNSKLLHGQTQNEEMLEIQTEATIGMFKDTRQPNKQQFTKQLKTGTLIE